MFVYDRFLQRLTLDDAQGEPIADLKFYAPDKHGKEVSLDVPDGYEIIGLQTNTDLLYIHTIGFILWRPNKNATPASI